MYEELLITIFVLRSGPKSHQPTMIRISSDEVPSSKPTGQKSSSQLLTGRSAHKSIPPKRNSLTSSGGSPDSSLSRWE